MLMWVTHSRITQFRFSIKLSVLKHVILDSAHLTKTLEHHLIGNQLREFWSAACKDLQNILDNNRFAPARVEGLLYQFRFTLCLGFRGFLREAMLGPT